MTKQNQYRVIAAAFFGVLWLGFAGTWLGWGQFNAANERRALAPFPRFDRTFPEGLGLYLRDHFGFRGGLVTVNALLRAKLLHTSTTPDVLMGEEGFLFFAGEGALENYMGLKPMSDCEVNAWVSLFIRRAGLVHVPFVVVVVPNKETVYPEMMPAGLLRGVGKSRMDRVVAALSGRMQVVDLRSVLINKKALHRTYYLTDTHWSQWGAFWAYREMLPFLDKTAKPLAVAGLTRGIVEQTLDLNRMLGLNGFAAERAETFEPPAASNLVGHQDGPLMTIEGAPGKRLVFFRDSFGAALLPFLAAHFSRVYAPNGWTFDAAVVERERPDVVVVEIVERRFNAPPPVDPGSAAQFCPGH